MKTYKQVFENLKKKNEGALVAFTVIGDPNYKSSLEIAKALVDAGADMLELGLPFSDPMADGKSIQAADARALSKGMNTDKVFEFLKDLRKYTDAPVGLLSYYNLIYQRGIEKFYRDCKEAEVNSVLIADVAFEERHPIIAPARKHNIDTIFMITQLTNDGRIQKISEESNGFIYLVSRLGVTGARKNIQEPTFNLIRRVRNFTDKPLCVGFGISKPSHAKEVINAGADGAIMGSAIVDLIEKNLGNKRKMLEEISGFISNIKRATLKKTFSKEFLIS